MPNYPPWRNNYSVKKRTESGTTERLLLAPVGRVLVALVIVPLFTNVLFLLPAVYQERSDPRDLASSLLALPLAAVIDAWPGYVVFGVLGIPLIYLLARIGRTDFLVFAGAGAICTAAPWIILQMAAHAPHSKPIQLAPLFGVIGLANGVLTRLIVFGYR